MNAAKQFRQRIRYVQASDGARLAWAESGEGPVVVKAANWLTHLEYEWESPVWKHWLQFFSGHFRFVRYDERGCGMSESKVGDMSVDQWVSDLESVIEAAKPDEPVTLLGISQGAAACIGYALRHPERVARIILYGGYALRHPERVARIILYGGYARGAYRRGTPEFQVAYRAMIDLTRVAWGSDNPTFRQLFTSRFIPGGSAEQLQWFNDLCRKTTTGEVAAQLLESRGAMDVEGLLDRVRMPTLVLHAREDAVIPMSEGRLLAAAISGAEFVELDSRNHILLADEPAWKRFQDAVLAFARPEGAADAAVFAALSVRERQVLSLMGEGLSNTDIAERLHISEKTVRNHASNIFDKLGVWSRTQAIVFARDRGFTGFSVD